MQDRALRRWFGLAVLFATLTRASAVERSLAIRAPATAAAGQAFEVVFTAATNAGQGEQVGFLQAEVSLDGGVKWTAVCYAENLGPDATRSVSITPGAAGSAVQVRVRAAYRGGLAGDVDYTGAALRWHGPWKEWLTPPARHATVNVTAR